MEIKFLLTVVVAAVLLLVFLLLLLLVLLPAKAKDSRNYLSCCCSWIFHLKTHFMYLCANRSISISQSITYCRSLRAGIGLFGNAVVELLHLVHRVDRARLGRRVRRRRTSNVCRNIPVGKVSFDYPKPLSQIKGTLDYLQSLLFVYTVMC